MRGLFLVTTKLIADIIANCENIDKLIYTKLFDDSIVFFSFLFYLFLLLLLMLLKIKCHADTSSTLVLVIYSVNPKVYSFHSSITMKIDLNTKY